MPARIGGIKNAHDACCRWHKDCESLTSFRPVVTRTTLSEDKVVRAEKRAQGSGADRVHGSGLEVDQDSSRNVLVGADFVVVDVDTLKLKVVVALVQTLPVNAMFV